MEGCGFPNLPRFILSSFMRWPWDARGRKVPDWLGDNLPYMTKCDRRRIHRKRITAVNDRRTLAKNHASLVTYNMKHANVSFCLPPRISRWIERGIALVSREKNFARATQTHTRAKSSRGVYWVLPYNLITVLRSATPVTDNPFSTWNALAAASVCERCTVPVRGYAQVPVPLQVVLQNLHRHAVCSVSHRREPPDGGRVQIASRPGPDGSRHALQPVLRLKRGHHRLRHGSVPVCQEI